MYDATGKLVGRHFAYPAGVVMNLNGVQTFVSLHGAGNISGFNLPDYDKTDLMELGQLFFATPDCTGPGYVNPELMTAYGMKRGVMVLDGVGRRYVYRITAGRPVLVNAITQYSRGVCSPAGHEMEYFQTEITPVEVTEFAPPFDIR